MLAHALEHGNEVGIVGEDGTAVTVAAERLRRKKEVGGGVTDGAVRLLFQVPPKPCAVSHSTLRPCLAAIGRIAS